jgi:hypothetical protein
MKTWLIVALLLVNLPLLKGQSIEYCFNAYNNRFIDTMKALINKSRSIDIEKCYTIPFEANCNRLQDLSSPLRIAIIKEAQDFIEMNKSICIFNKGTDNIVEHIYSLMSQWQGIYSRLQTYVFPQENIYERQERQMKSLDSSLQCISEYVERLNQSKIISDNSHNNPLDSIIDRLDSIKSKMPFTHSPDYSTKFDSMNRYLFKIDSVSKSIDTLTKEMNDHIAKIKEELVDNKKHYLSIMAGFEYHRSVSKKSNVFIGLGGIEFRKDSSAIAGRVGVTTQGLPIVSVSYQFSPVCYAVVQTIGIHSTTLPNSRTLLSGHIGYKLPNIIQLELGVYGYLIGEQNFSIGIGAKTALTSIKF